MIPTIEIDKRELDRFQGALGKMIAIAGEKASLVVRKVAFDLLRDIIRATPVDTGRARAGWTAWFDSTGASMPLGGSSSGVARGRGESSFQANLPAKGQVPATLTIPGLYDKPFVEVTNNVKYILPLEFGWSRQAPSGMVRITFRRHARKLMEGLEAV